MKKKIKKYEKACDEVCKHVEIGESITSHDAIQYVRKAFQDSKSMKQYLRIDPRFEKAGNNYARGYKLTLWKRIK